MFQIYTNWANHYLEKSNHKRLITDLQADVRDGVLLADVIQSVSKFTFHKLFLFCDQTSSGVNATAVMLILTIEGHWFNALSKLFRTTGTKFYIWKATL